MAAAGYSGTPLLKKLGLTDDMRVMLINEPENYFELIEKNIDGQICRKNELPDLVHLFVTNEKSFKTEMKKIKPFLKPTTSIWVSWYKKSAGIATDITEHTIRSYALENDLVDIKVCAVSEIWSGLKLVTPLVKRPKKYQLCL